MKLAFEQLEELRRALDVVVDAIFKHLEDNELKTEQEFEDEIKKSLEDAYGAGGYPVDEDVIKKAARKMAEYARKKT